MRNHNKNILFSLLFFIVFGLSIGYSYLNTSLFINGTSIINANIWSIGFNNLYITKGSETASISPTISSTSTSTNFEVKLENQEDFYEFSVDVINNGDYDARLNSLVETTGLTTEQANYFDYTVSYQNGDAILVNQLVKKDDFVRIKIKVSYKENVDITQVPDSVKTLNLGFNLNYDLDDGNGMVVEDNGKQKITITSNYSLDDAGSVVTIGTEKFYVIGAEGDNVKLLSMYNLHIGNKYDTTNGVIALENPTGIQDISAKGWFSGYNPSNPIIGTLPFSSTNYWSDTVSEYPAYVYNEKSILYNYLEDYNKYLDNLGAIVNDSRLISAEELDLLGCSSLNNTCKEAPAWVYSTTYWVGTAISENQIRRIDRLGDFITNTYDHNVYGIRPIIVIPKSEIISNNKHLIKFTIDGVAYQGGEDMTWEDWTGSLYNTSNFMFDDGDRLTLDPASGKCVLNSDVPLYRNETISSGNFSINDYSE